MAEDTEESVLCSNNTQFTDGRPPSVIDRYFKRHYKTDILNQKSEDQLVLSHSNRVCVVCLAESHPIIHQKKQVTKVSFEGPGWSRLQNKLSGKAKRGAQWLDGNSPLCQVTCSDGSVYTLYCCIKGQLVEINEKLTHDPNLLSVKHCGDGYLAVILPGLKWFDKEINQLKTDKEYQEIIAGRGDQT